MYFVGVDAGGTKTAFVLSDENGHILARCLRGGGAYFDIGADGIYTLVADGVAELCRLAGLAKCDTGLDMYAGMGFPGYGEQEGSEAVITKTCRKAFVSGLGIQEVQGMQEMQEMQKMQTQSTGNAHLLSNRVVCECDSYLGWAGSLAMSPGINIVAGTGSICFGVNEKGETARCGGWGAFCDEGSCRWLGGKLIQLFARQSDGRMPRTALYDMMRSRLGITRDIDFVHPINCDYGPDAAKTAGLQRLLAEIYDAGDTCAKALYQEAAEELALAADSTARKLHMKAGYTVSYSGGLFNAGERILAPLRMCVKRNGGVLIVPKFSPELGAVLMAMRRVWPEKDFSLLRFSEAV